MGFDVKLTEPQSRFFMSEAKYCAAVAGFGAGRFCPIY